MAMTAEQRKIKRLEKQVADFKQEVTDLKERLRRQDNQLMYERQWRQDFQKLVKEAVQDNTLPDYERDYW